MHAKLVGAQRLSSAKAEGEVELAEQRATRHQYAQHVTSIGPRIHNGTAVPGQIKVAHNFPRSFFEHCSKRCNSNDANSKFEAAAGELRATLSRNYTNALHRTRPRGMTRFREDYTSSGGLHQFGRNTPVREEYTRKGALHQLGSITPPPNWCNTHLSGATPLSNKPECGLARVERSRSSTTSSHTDR